MFFVRRRFALAETMADEVLDRVAQRLEAGEVLGSPEAYAHGVARFIAQEQAREAVRADAAGEVYTRNISLNSDTPDEEQFEAMSRCLARQRNQDRELLVAYYAFSGIQKIDHRRRLALSMDISQGALRKRVFRLRAAIEECMRLRLRRDREGQR
ncbi:MAG: hypothetical protein ACLGXA_21160 [Acidobacteriota bacterium]